MTVLGQPAGSRGAAPPGRLRHPGAAACTPTSRCRRTCATSPAVLGAAAATSTACSREVGPRRARRRSSSARLSGGQRAPGLARCRAARRAASCSCSTSRRSAWTRCCAATCGRCSTARRRRRRRCWCRSHVMDEAERCDRLLLMRDGRAARRRHPGAACSSAPAPTTSRHAFLALIARARDERRHGARPRRHARRTRPRRVLRQLRHDRRTVALLLVVPCCCSTLLRVDLRRTPGRLRPVRRRRCSALFPFIVMFLVTVDRDAAGAHAPAPWSGC